MRTKGYHGFVGYVVSDFDNDDRKGCYDFMSRCSGSGSPGANIVS